LGKANVLVRKVAESLPLKLDLGCGKAKKEGFLGVDALKFESVDVVADLRKQWPWKDATVEEVHCSHFLEHLTGEERVHFFNELYRVLKPAAKATIVCPHWSSERAYGDPTHKWPPVTGFSFYYLSKVWREGNAPHTEYVCDFEASWGFALAHPWQLKAQEVQMFAMGHYTNVCNDIVATVLKK
jgi:SAM-dependent methyltransferase